VKNISYARTIIDNDEKIKYIASVTLLILFQPILAIFIALFISIVFLKDTVQNHDLNIFLFIFGPSLLIGALVQLVKLFFYIFTTEIVKTDRRMIFKRGFVARDTIEIPLSQIESVNVNQSILGRIFGFGDLLIIGTGGTHQDIKYIANILKFRKAII
jgi:uncharacterized membrane protein YdbT with pleckstrin-like domain